MAPKVTIGQAYGQTDTGAGSLIITELTGDERTIELSGRALPYKPMGWEGEHRIEEIEAAGFAKTSQQPNGPKEKPSAWKGAWKDRFLGDGTEKFANVTSASSSGSTNSPDATETISASSTTIRRASELTELMDDVRRKGQLLRVSFLHITRIGRLSSFKQDWQTAHDVEWSMEFKWTGRDEDTPSATPGAGLINSTQSISTSYVALEDATGFDDLENLNPNYGNVIDNAVRGLQGLVTDAENNVERRVGGAISAVDAARRMITTLTDLRDEAEEFIATLQTRAAPAMIAVADESQLLGVPAGQAIAAACARIASVKCARDLKHTAARQRFEAEKSLDTDLLAVVRIKENQDLRALARIYYKNPEDCEIIRAYNGFRGYTVDMGTVVLIPVPVNA